MFKSLKKKHESFYLSQLYKDVVSKKKKGVEKTVLAGCRPHFPRVCIVILSAVCIKGKQRSCGAYF